MIRLFLITLLFVFLYLGFSLINEYDTNIHIALFSYYIDVSLFFALSILIVSYLAITFVMRIISTILNTPSAIANKIKSSKINDQKKKLLDSYRSLVYGNKKNAYDLVNKIKDDLVVDSPVDLHFLLGMTDQDNDRKIYHLKYLLDFSEYKSFAAKELARYFFEYKYYKQVLEYIKLIEPDIDVLKILVETYANMENWDEFEESLDKLASINMDAVNEMSEKIANWYFLAAKSVLETDDNKQIIFYLEKALLYKPDLISAIELLCYLNNNDGLGKLNKKIIETAFVLSPSFDLGLLYIKSTNASPREVYLSLSSLADFRSYSGVFLSIASYLDLNDEVDNLKSFLSV